MINVEQKTYFERRIINVPQGRSARLIKNTEKSGPVGLYTDNFSNCQIVAMIGETRLALIHVDMNTHITFYQSDVDWMGDDLKKVVTIYREDFVNPRTVEIHENLKKKFKDKLEFKKLKREYVGGFAKFDGVYVAFDNLKADYAIGLKECERIQILLANKRPTELVFHPDEKKLVAKQKIEQIIGVYARSKKGTLTPFKVNIFDGEYWQTFEKAELEVTVKDEDTKKEFEIFKPNQSFVEVAAGLYSIIIRINQNCEKKNQLSLDARKKLIMEVAHHLTSYLNGYDTVKIFNQDIKLLIRDSLKGLQLESGEDVKPDSAGKEILIKLRNALDNQDKPEVMLELICDYEKTKPDSSFKKEFLNNISTIESYYKNRLVYDQQEKKYNSLISQAKDVNSKAVAQFTSNNFDDANHLFHNALLKLKYAVTKSHRLLATTYWNLGRTYQKQTEYDNAIIYLEKAKRLKKYFLKEKPEKIKKITKAIEECKEERAKFSDCSQLTFTC